MLSEEEWSATWRFRTPESLIDTPKMMFDCDKLEEIAVILPGKDKIGNHDDNF